MMKQPKSSHGIANAFGVSARSRILIAVVAFLVALAGGRAATLQANGVSISELIDREISARLAEEGIAPAPTIDDAAFVRRVTLDLAGRIPTTRETEEFLARPESHRRELYVDRLLQTPDYAVHLRNELDLLLQGKLGRYEDWRNYLLEVAQENRSWDRFAREILVPEKALPGERGPAAFLRERTGDVDRMTNDTSSLLFGVNISCAKCHDHPLVLDWQQDHYYGLASFFDRTYRTADGSVAERFEGMPKFTTTYGEEKTAKFMFLTGAEAEEPKTSLTEEARKELRTAIDKAAKESDAEAPEPTFSPRAALVELALDEKEPMLARNIVNRTWARLIGRGLIEPLDQFHSYNPPSHPALLEGLTREFLAAGYDLKALIRGIVLSQTYARSCETPEGVEPPSPELFAVGAVRALTPRQLATSLDVATASPEKLPGLAIPASWEQERLALDERATGLAEQFALPGSAFQVGVDESLLFSNGTRIAGDLLRSGDDRLVGYLQRTSDDSAAVDQAFAAILSRTPTLEEREATTAYLADRADRRDEALSQVAWALLATAEFRFNH